MRQDMDDINLPVSGTRVGYVRSWMNGQQTWDGYLSRDEGPTDELVVNGTDRSWVEYLVLRRFQDKLLKDITEDAGIMRTLEERRAFSHRVSLILECSDSMRQALKVFLRGRP